jgi:competence protein ComEC
VLVDGGPRSFAYDAGHKVVVPFLRRHGVRQLAAVVVSHGDADHLGGLPAVIDAMGAALVLEPGQPLGTPLYLEYLASMDVGGIQWWPARAGDAFAVDAVRFDVVHPTSEWVARHLDPNENSVVLRVSYGCFVALLTGDIGWPAESVLVAAASRAHVLKVAHHGSAGGTRDAWLDAVDPEVAVVSVGRNRYGHPAEDVLQRLRARAITVFRTDRGGTVTIRSDGRYFEVEQGRSNNLLEHLTCLIQPWLRLSASSWSKSGCTRKPLVSSPICSTTSRLLPRSSPATSGAPDW